MALSNYGRGVYVLQLWATAGGTTPNSKVVENFKKQYGSAEIESLGIKANGINFSELTKAFMARIDSGANKESPNLADLNTPIFEIAGLTPGVLETAVNVIKEDALTVANKTVDVASSAIDLLKWLPLILIVGGIAYLSWSGVLKHAK